MALIPLNQSVKITKGGDLDEWGQPRPGRGMTLKCRIDQHSQLVKTQDGKEAVTSATILLNGLVTVNYSDLLEWKDETGNQYSLHPLTVAIVRDFTGKPLFTKVAV
ncbi:hypothetical protein SAMN05660649_04369 [Desulfotomaculum arcticum]|uniref:Uncharacterized protein n=1 Tax=Desulfotruncus arcticus DSM 17038 TaxID=1121424 RepID=A0A1I2YBE2_9FIRM|nr:hypothetical protein [Desulfotruncus arcticus]SFH23044.1 hypothetical protein SAMN05660649_04369 [Desulfotomaculum arcticum] [Desulfotruncus arcticus DSM 17038]